MVIMWSFLVFLLVCPLDYAQSTRQEKTGCESKAYIKKWQTVVPDTGIVIPLTDMSARNSSSWTLHCGDGKYVIENPRLPSDILTNLWEAGIIGDPYYERNFLTERYVWMGDHVDDQIHTTRTRTWIYNTTFKLPATSGTSTTWKLVVEGIKMGAHISINGIPVETVTNQFRRYEFDITFEQLAEGNYGRDRTTSTTGILRQEHTLTITFDPTIPVNGRFTACSGGWDWAPYTRSYDSQGRRSYTFGIMKPIYLIAVDQFVIRHVVPKIYYRGPYPRTPMREADPDGDFEMHLNIHVGAIPDIHSLPSGDSHPSIKAVVANQAVLLPIQRNNVSRDEFILTATITFPSSDVRLWWPNGMGEQPLYDVLVGFVDSTNSSEPDKWISSVIHKRIAFRTVSLVTINETDDTSFEGILEGKSEGSGSHGMYFRINGVPLLARGSNVIPMDQLEGRQTDIAHRIVVKSAVDANMNMLRVWGGGMVLTEAFYDACDEYGILLYHDMMFVDEAGHGPELSQSVELEIRYFVRTLANHPSIVIWSGCNECQVVMNTPSEIYASFIMTTVAEEDDTRSIWPSSPSKHGWKTGVHTLDSRPNGNKLTTWSPADFNHDLETHGPYMRSYSLDYPAVNGIPASAALPYRNTPPTFRDDEIGIEKINNFASEFGASVYSSADSMSGTISPSHWSLHGNSYPDRCEQIIGDMYNCFGKNVMAERNYPCDTHIQAYFGNVTNLDAVGGNALQEQTFHCMMAQTLWMKGEIESRRSMNSFGLLIWQLNENWPTGGWGCIEYGPAHQNDTQVMGGRWKPLMHLLESSLFRDIMVACGKHGKCYVRNDGDAPLYADIVIECWQLGTDQYSERLEIKQLIENNSIYRFKVDDKMIEYTDTCTLQVFDQTNLEQLVETVFLLTHPKDMIGLTKPVSIDTSIVTVGDSIPVEIKLSSNHLALFVVLTCRAQGRFSENAFVLRPHQEKAMIGDETMDAELLRQTLRIEHLGFYLAKSRDDDDHERHPAALTQHESFVSE